jgi:hypothetical protein
MRRWLSIGVLCALGCGSMRSPSGVADKFVDKYYVEADQKSALPLSDGVAKLRLQNEIELIGGARLGLAPGSHAARVYYSRTAISEAQDSARADYSLKIKPQGGTEIARDAHLELLRQGDGTWRVVRFNETTPR